MKDDETTREVFAVIGLVVGRYLKPDTTLSPQEIIDALHAMSVGGRNRFLSGPCREAIRLLAQKMH